VNNKILYFFLFVSVLVFFQIKLFNESNIRKRILQLYYFSDNQEEILTKEFKNKLSSKLYFYNEIGLLKHLLKKENLNEEDVIFGFVRIAEDYYNYDYDYKKNNNIIQAKKIIKYSKGSFEILLEFRVIDNLTYVNDIHSMDSFLQFANQEFELLQKMNCNL
jgi:hypothetical protein